jgi:hypothetical protein
MTSPLLSEILEWSKGRPLWQRDALRRLFAADLTHEDVEELVEICKSGHGLAEPPNVAPLSAEHLAISDEATEPVSLISVTHHEGVNALAPSQTLNFGSGLTVVYGENAAGKSGYTRILKLACRARATEKILGNVLSGSSPVVPRATITIRQGTDELSVDWTPKAQPSEQLAAISVFDAQCVPAYLRDKTDVAFRPFGLDVFDKLSEACGSVRDILDRERTLLNTNAVPMPAVAEVTAVKKLLDSLSALTPVDKVRQLADLSETDKARLKELRQLQADLRSTDPKKLARELALKADRIDDLVHHLAAIEEAFTETNLKGIAAGARDLHAAKATLDSVQRAAMTADLLPGTGGPEWKAMWDAAEAFSDEAYSGQPFPVIANDAKCILCQQPIGRHAADRLKHFAEYVNSTAQDEVRKAEATLSSITRPVTGVTIERPGHLSVIEEVAEDSDAAADELRQFIQTSVALQNETRDALETNGHFPSKHFSRAPIEAVTSIVQKLRARVDQLKQSASGMPVHMESELNELSARESLNTNLATVIGEIERKKRIGAYTQCLDDCTTAAVTRKSTELTKRLITDALQQSFEGELAQIGFTHLAVEIQAAGGSRGALFHRLVFTHAPGVAVTDVLSEGEARALSLASFLTELKTAPTSSAIIFDDPVSSLDHLWRERIARRLVDEARRRQVIVFTHDLLFLHYLIGQAETQGVSINHQYVRRSAYAGVVLPDLPWAAMTVKGRLGVLKNRLQAAEKIHKTESPDRYESEAREIYGLLREAWEQAVSEVLLNDVVARYRPSIETKKTAKLYDITKDDVETVDKEMTECSRWIRGHDAPPADGTPVPDPNELAKRLATFEDWVRTIRKRRQ